MPHPLRQKWITVWTAQVSMLQSLARCPTPCDDQHGRSSWRDTSKLQSLARCPTPCDKDLELYRKHYAPVAISGEMPHPLRRPLHTTSDMKNSCCNLWRDAPPLATPHSLTRKINCLLLQSLARCPTPCDFDSQCGRADSAVLCR